MTLDHQASALNPEPELSLPQVLNQQVWVLASGRLVYQVGYGFIQFYGPIVFVNRVGLSTTAVGIAMGVGSLAGIAGHFLGGALADAPSVGRKKTLGFAAGLAILTAIGLALTHTLPMLMIANLLMGISTGFYWTAADAAAMDVTQPEARHKAFAVLGLADSLGVGIGVLGGGILMTQVAQTQTLFGWVGLVFLGFWLLLQTALHEAKPPLNLSAQATPAETQPLQPSSKQRWSAALSDRRLRIFVLANVLFTTYIAIVNTSLPLYLTNFRATAPQGESLAQVATLFTGCYVGIGAVLQLPIVYLLSPLPRVRVLMISMLLWSSGFLLLWTTAWLPSTQVAWVIAALGILSMATAIYKPFAAAIVAELAPASMRGTYLALTSQCWAVGYFIGPLLGGWALDQTPAIAHNSWSVALASTVCGLIMLHSLDRATQAAPTSSQPALP